MKLLVWIVVGLFASLSIAACLVISVSAVSSAVSGTRPGYFVLLPIPVLLYCYVVFLVVRDVFNWSIKP